MNSAHFGHVKATSGFISRLVLHSWSSVAAFPLLSPCSGNKERGYMILWEGDEEAFSWLSFIPLLEKWSQLQEQSYAFFHTCIHARPCHWLNTSATKLFWHHSVEHNFLCQKLEALACPLHQLAAVSTDGAQTAPLTKFQLSAPAEVVSPKSPLSSWSLTLIPELHAFTQLWLILDI